MQDYKKFSGAGLYGQYEFFKPILVVCDTDILKQILVKEFDSFMDRRPFGNQPGSIMGDMLSNKTGQEWKILRSIISPTFSSGKMKKMYPLVCTTAETLVSSCLSDAAKDPHLDMKDKFGRFTMDTIASCAFGIDSQSFTAEKPVFAQRADNFFSMTLYKFVKFMFLMIAPQLAYKVGVLADNEDIEFFRQVVEETISTRQKHDQRGDFLDLMLQVRETDDEQQPTSVKHGNLSRL